MPSTRFAYDVSTGEHVMLGQANMPKATDFSNDILEKQAQRDKRLARKQRQRARKRAMKRAEASETPAPISAACPDTISVTALPAPPPILSLLQPAAEGRERLRVGQQRA